MIYRLELGSACMKFYALAWLYIVFRNNTYITKKITQNVKQYYNPGELMGEQQVGMPTERQDICRFDVGMGNLIFFLCR